MQKIHLRDKDVKPTLCIQNVHKFSHCLKCTLEQTVIPNELI